MRATIIALAAIVALVGNASALTPKDLTPQEQALHAKVKKNPKLSEAFFATRDYVRKSAAVVAAPDNKALAFALRRPANYDERFLLEGDEDTLNEAANLSLNAIAEKMWPA